MSPRLVSALDWREHDGFFSCHLLLHNHGFTSLPLTPGTKINFKILPGRRCIGYHQLSPQTSVGEWRRITPCPTSSLARVGPQCPSCQARDITASCLRCRGEICTALGHLQAACSNSRAYVYLAAFGGKLKVGISGENRYITRWVEQGADAALRVLMGNGSEVRRLEHLIHSQLGVPESVRIGLKVSSLVNRNKTKQALALLSETRCKVHSITSSERHFNEDPWILASHYNIPSFKQRPIVIKVSNGVTVAGEVVGVKGPILLMKSNEVLFVLGLPTLLGRNVELSSTESTSQTGLYSFLKK